GGAWAKYAGMTTASASRESSGTVRRQYITTLLLANVARTSRSAWLGLPIEAWARGSSNREGAVASRMTSVYVPWAAATSLSTAGPPRNHRSLQGALPSRATTEAKATSPTATACMWALTRSTSL